MTETPNPQIENARKKMQALGVNQRLADVLLFAASPEEVNRQIPGSGLMIDAQQGIAYAFQGLFKLDPSILDRARAVLLPIIAPFDLPDSFIEDYLIKWGDYPGFKFEFEFGDKVDIKSRNKIGEAAKQCELNIIKEYLSS